MGTNREGRIRERAYLSWADQDRPEGQALDHWLRAELELGRATGPSSGAAGDAPAPARTRRTKPKSAKAGASASPRKTRPRSRPRAR